jgi:2'-5' RNA ligase
MYTLWLIPDDAAYNKLTQLIVDLSTVHETPQFEPHVTLLSGITDRLDVAIEKADELANSLSTISASLTKIDFLELYYRCLFFCTNDSEEILYARELAEDIFEHTNINPFIPHISFLYGSLPIFEKQSIIEDLGKDFFMDFKMTKLRLVKTQRTPEHWELITEFDL